jgi:F0F1-type ATP synthase epsilon subunit
VPEILNNNKKDASALDTHVRSRTDTYFQGKATSVTSVNATGEFDILAMHANFITLVKDYVILDKTLPTEKKIEFKTAVLSVVDGKVDVYVGV